MIDIKGPTSKFIKIRCPKCKNELVKLAKFAHKVGAGKKCPPIGIQNFLHYRFGRNPIKAMEMDVFYKKLQDLEQKHSIKLINKDYMFKIKECKELPKPFKKGDIVEAELVCPGRFNHEMLAVNCKARNKRLARHFTQDRLISVPNCYKQEGFVKLRIKRSKHNIFLGELLG